MNVINLHDRVDRAVEENLEGVGFAGLPNEESLERHIGLFRRFIQHFGQKAAEARQLGKSEMKLLGADRRAEQERHRKAMAEIDDREAEIRTRCAENTAAAQRLADSYADALASAEGRL